MSGVVFQENFDLYVYCSHCVKIIHNVYLLHIQLRLRGVEHLENQVETRIEICAESGRAGKPTQNFK